MPNGNNTVLSDLPDNTTNIFIGDTTYIVSSFFNKDAKSDVINKVRRLIEREVDADAENIASNNGFTGNPDRVRV